MAAVAVTTTAVGVVQQIQTAKAQNAAIQNAYAVQTEQIRQNETSDINDRLRAARKEQGRIKVAAGEAGLQLSGSVAGLLRDSTMQTALYDERIRANADNRVAGAGAEATSQFSQVQEPTALGAGLQIAGAAVKGYYTGSGIMASRSAAARGG
jgi:hypothetical protein